MERGMKTRLVTALILVAVFGAGVLLGLAADSNLDATPPEVVVETPEVEAEEPETEAEEPPRRRRVYEQVNPTEAQLEQIDAIIG